jgi:hypothetical protein
LWRNIGSAAFLIERFLVEIEICCVARPSHRIQSSNQRSLGAMATLEEVSIDDEIDQEILKSSTDDIVNRTRLLENEIKVQSRRLLI